MKVKNATCSECCETLQSRFGMVPGHLYSCWHLLHLFLWQPLPPCAQHILGVLCVTRGAELYWPATHPCQHLSGATAEYDTVSCVHTEAHTGRPVEHHALRNASAACRAKSTKQLVRYLSITMQAQHLCLLADRVNISEPGFQLACIRWTHVCHKNPNSHRASQDAFKADSCVSCTHKHPCSARPRCVKYAWAP
jgi:hypothetical protein